MPHSNEGSAFQLGLTINDLLCLEGFPSVSDQEREGIIFRREIDMNTYNLCYALAYRIWEQNQNKGNDQIM
jgi:hypothetical protein